MNPDLNRLQSYPFEKLARLYGDVTPPADKPAINLAIGEPQHSAPGFIIEEIITHLHGLSHYPKTKGTIQLRESIATWLRRRFAIPVEQIDPEIHILPVNGTREALFAFAQCIIDRHQGPLVVIPNPFYQIYEGAALLAGAEPWFINTSTATHWLPDFDSVPSSVWDHCQLLYLCSPGNPSGAVMDLQSLTKVIQLADKHDFIIASDECYSEIYLDETSPPPGLLQAALRTGNTNYQRCIVFHSLSKRSNVPGMRSGFVAGDADIIKKFLLYRTYHGCTMPAYTQAASIMAWQDEQHVKDNRELYRSKFDKVLEILEPVMTIDAPAASFYLWPETPVEDTDFAKQLFARHNVTVLPGTYLSRDAHGCNPGHRRARIALVPTIDSCVEAAERIREFLATL